MGMRVRISRCVVEIIQRAAAEVAPREACGLLFGSDNEISGCEVAENVAENPERHFEIDPRALFAAIRAERAGGVKLAGYWHSHPSGKVCPSYTDHQMAAADGKLWLIVAGEDLALWRPVESQIFSWDTEEARATGCAALDRTVTSFQRVAATTGDVRHVIPRDKSDVDLVPLLAEAGYPAIAPYLDELVAWTFDPNWPIAYPMADFLIALGEPIVDPLLRTLREDSVDPGDKGNCIGLVVARMPSALRPRFHAELARFAETPSEAEQYASVDALAREVLEAWGDAGA